MMIKSMTGFGKYFMETDKFAIQVEIRSLNSKQLDVNFKLPNYFKAKEPALRKFFSEKLARGKIDVFMNYVPKNPEPSASLNESIIKNYYRQLLSMAENHHIPEPEDPMSIIMQFPETFKYENAEIDETDWNEVFKAIEMAAIEVNQFRMQEGEALEKDFRLHIKSILQYLKTIDENKDERIEKIRSRLLKNFENYMDPKDIDQNRFEQEIIFYLEKLDITEEIVRLKNHCDYFVDTMTNEEIAGKKLSFIAQEIGREINTIGSKANDSIIQKNVIMMKDDLEKIKEQLLNVL